MDGGHGGSGALEGATLVRGWTVRAQKPGDPLLVLSPLTLLLWPCAGTKWLCGTGHLGLRCRKAGAGPVSEPAASAGCAGSQGDPCGHRAAADRGLPTSLQSEMAPGNCSPGKTAGGPAILSAPAESSLELAPPFSVECVSEKWTLYPCCIFCRRKIPKPIGIFFPIA